MEFPSPQAQRSTGIPYGSLFSTSGDRYPGVPANPYHAICDGFSSSIAKPKSASFTGGSRVLSASKRFSGYRGGGGGEGRGRGGEGEGRGGGGGGGGEGEGRGRGRRGEEEGEGRGRGGGGGGGGRGRGRGGEGEEGGGGGEGGGEGGGRRGGGWEGERKISSVIETRMKRAFGSYKKVTCKYK